VAQEIERERLAEEFKKRQGEDPYVGGGGVGGKAAAGRVKRGTKA